VVPRERWTSTSASDAFRRLQRAAGGRLLVLDEGRPVGTLGLGDLTALLTWSRRRP
jgi:hypothetical protein